MPNSFHSMLQLPRIRYAIISYDGYRERILFADALVITAAAGAGIEILLLRVSRPPISRHISITRRNYCEADSYAYIHSHQRSRNLAAIIT